MVEDKDAHASKQLGRLEVVEVVIVKLRRAARFQVHPLPANVLVMTSALGQYT